MIEYPSIIGPSKAPRQPCLAFEKFDGSNIRVKYTAKNGFTIFGSRTQLLDASHRFLGEVIPLFQRDFAPELTKLFKKEFPNEKEMTVFGEFFGPSSFAGLHVQGEPKEFVMFDLMFTRKGQNTFMMPQVFCKTFRDVVRTPAVVYEGNVNDELIRDVREGKYDVNEGVVCKGTQSSGAYRGKVWMCKIKTNAYLERLRTRFGSDWTKYAE